MRPAYESLPVTPDSCKKIEDDTGDLFAEPPILSSFAFAFDLPFLATGAWVIDNFVQLTPRRK